MYILTNTEKIVVTIFDKLELKRVQLNGYAIPATPTSATHYDVDGELYSNALYKHEKLEEIHPEVTADGTWLYENGEFNRDEDLTAEYIRSERSKLFDESDKMMLSDRGYDLEKVKEYRQKLRDLPQKDGFPFVAEFPELPAKTTVEEG